VFSSFLPPIIWAAIFALVFYPLYDRTLRQFRGRTQLASLAMTTLVTLLLVLPTISLSSAVTGEAAGLYRQVDDYVRSGRLNQTIEQLRQSRPGRLLQRLSREGPPIDYAANIQRVVDTVSSQATTFARNVATFVLDFVIMVFTLFFFFRDGDRMYRALRDVIPMDPEHKETIFRRLYETLSAVVRGMLLTALVQGLLTWAGLWVLGVPFSAFLGVVATFLSFIPLVGAAGVWVPAALYLFFAGDVIRALVLVAYGTLGISMIDNVMRPFLIGERTRLPTLFLFFGILGGVEAYGVLGVFLGPVLLAISVAFLQIYKEQYATADSAPTSPAASAAV
jgi:predicted PurR-regulated permease PerM